MPPASDSAAARELAAILKVRMDDQEHRYRELRTEMAEVRAEVVKLRDTVGGLRETLAEARGQRSAALDWRSVAFSSVGALAGLVGAAKAFGLL